MFVAIYYDTFYDAEPVKQDKKIFEVSAKVFNNERSDYGCLGS